MRITECRQKNIKIGRAVSGKFVLKHYDTRILKEILREIEEKYKVAHPLICVSSEHSQSEKSKQRPSDRAEYRQGGLQHSPQVLSQECQRQEHHSEPTRC